VLKRNASHKRQPKLINGDFLITGW
jgi:hypothetical protein